MLLNLTSLNLMQWRNRALFCNSCKLLSPKNALLAKKSRLFIRI